MPNIQPAVFALPSGENPIPAGFAFGPFVDAEARRDFMFQDELYDGTFMIPVPAGTWFVAVQTEAIGKQWEGYLSRELGLQWFLTVQPGEVVDVSAHPISVAPKADER